MRLIDPFSDECRSLMGDVSEFNSQHRNQPPEGLLGEILGFGLPFVFSGDLLSFPAHPPTQYIDSSTPPPSSDENDNPFGNILW